jgi:hypothetical protein
MATNREPWEYRNQKKSSLERLSAPLLKLADNHGLKILGTTPPFEEFLSRVVAKIREI